MPEILTVGHSTHELSELVALLSGAAIEAIADVQRFPGSRRHPQFASASLAQTLPQAKIGCLHLSEQGGRRAPQADSPNTAWRNDSFRGYADHLRSHEFTVGLSWLEAMATANGRRSCAPKRSGGAVIAVCWLTCFSCVAGRAPCHARRPASGTRAVADCPTRGGWPADLSCRRRPGEAVGSIIEPGCGAPVE